MTMSRKALLAGALAGLAACGDARISKLTPNITRDSALRIIGADAAPGDSMPHLYREAAYLYDGKFYRVAFYTPTDRKEADSVAQGKLAEKDLTPLVFVGDTLKVWGWKSWDSLAVLIKAPVAPRN